MVGTAFNVYSVLECRAKAESLRRRASEKNKEADRLRDRRLCLQKRKSSLPEEMGSIRKKIGNRLRPSNFIRYDVTFLSFLREGAGVGGEEFQISIVLVL